MTITQIDDTVGIFLSQFRVMSDHNDKPVSGNFLEQFHDLNTGLGVKRTGRFICQQDIRVIY